MLWLFPPPPEASGQGTVEVSKVGSGKARDPTAWEGGIVGSTRRPRLETLPRDGTGFLVPAIQVGVKTMQPARRSLPPPRLYARRGSRGVPPFLARFWGLARYLQLGSRWSAGREGARGRRPRDFSRGSPAALRESGGELGGRPRGARQPPARRPT